MDIYKLPLWPNVKYQDDSFWTSIRVKDNNGVWYRTCVMESFKNDDLRLDISLVLNLFNQSVYRSLLLMKVDPQLLDGYGEYVFILDPLQISEEERLIQEYDNTRYTNKQQHSQDMLQCRRSSDGS